MRVTSKGQVTIPKPIRDRLGIEEGSEVEFVEDQDGVRLVRQTERANPDVQAREFQQWFQSVRGTIDTNGMDGKDFVDWLRGPYEDLDPY
ncbi:AbrB/MazE/SpoVT family DNA-binding domain-containing protein [Tianweitania sp.]|uniref:AbrB/MazE/SpoVT family DNA-binding domain-containing protein n=1 Tax=Tianweitania sp. TaxID=2021634 RepID=UPI00289D5AA3|nr:AbrB/MazE/SpoVT family DNA-binding domain-containing protein [Tianweitania sp.]